MNYFFRVMFAISMILSGTSNTFILLVQFMVAWEYALPFLRLPGDDTLLPTFGFVLFLFRSELVIAGFMLGR